MSFVRAGGYIPIPRFSRPSSSASSVGIGRIAVLMPQADRATVYLKVILQVGAPAQVNAVGRPGMIRHHFAARINGRWSKQRQFERIPVNPRTLETKYPGIYAVGDGANTGTPKAGVFAEGAARAVASDLIAKLRNSGKATQYNGFGTCYIEFGGGRVGKVEVDFFSGPKPTGTYHEPSVAMRADKELFGSSRRARWFGL